MVATGEGVLEGCRAFVKNCLAQYDGSHDFAHIERVYNVADTLVEKAELAAPPKSFTAEDLLVLRLACLLHDVDDHKYQATGNVKKFFDELEGRDVSAEARGRVEFIIENIGYKSELKHKPEDY